MWNFVYARVPPGSLTGEALLEVSFFATGCGPRFGDKSWKAAGCLFSGCWLKGARAASWPDWLACWLVGWLAGWADWLAGWLAGPSVVGRWVGCFGWLVG